MKRHVEFACTAATARSNISNLRQRQRAAWLLLVDAYTAKLCINISSKHLKPQICIWLRGCVAFTEMLCEAEYPYMIEVI